MPTLSLLSRYNFFYHPNKNTERERDRFLSLFDLSVQFVWLGLVSLLHFIHRHTLVTSMMMICGYDCCVYFQLLLHLLWIGFTSSLVVCLCLFLSLSSSQMFARSFFCRFCFSFIFLLLNADDAYDTQTIHDHGLVLNSFSFEIRSCVCVCAQLASTVSHKITHCLRCVAFCYTVSSSSSAPTGCISLVYFLVICSLILSANQHTFSLCK